MISVKQAQKLIQKETQTTKNSLSNKQIKITKYKKEILAENLIADRDYPPFDRVMMDGIGINFSDYHKGIRKYKITNCQKAGETQKIIKKTGDCIEVMTGAILPQGVDTIIKIEDLIINNNYATIKNTPDTSNIKKSQFIHKKASDKKKKSILVKKNSKLLPTHLAIAASVGKNKILVKNSPKIAIITTGDELININQTPTKFQIRRTNSYAITASLHKNGFLNTKSYHIKDNKKILKTKLKKIIKKNQIIIITGGVSAGKFDYIPTILEKIGTKKIFHKVSQKPGKPMWFGTIQHTHNTKKLIFGLPGNPVSALVCHTRYILPTLRQMTTNSKKTTTRHNNTQIYSKLKQNILLKNKLTNFLPVKIHFTKKGKIKAKLIPINTSGDFTSLSDSDGFIEINQQNNTINTCYPFYHW